MEKEKKIASNYLDLVSMVTKQVYIEMPVTQAGIASLEKKCSKDPFKGTYVK